MRTWYRAFRGWIAELGFPGSCYDQNDSTHNRGRAQNRRYRHSFFGLGCCFNRSEIHNLFAVRIAETLVRKREGPKHDQNYARDQGWFHRAKPETFR